MSETIQIHPSKITVHGEMQNRAELNPNRVAYFRELNESNELIDPVQAVFDGQRYYLWDGFHRHRGAVEANAENILVQFVKGTQEDAEWLACGANKEHDRGGLYRTNADKRRAIKKALRLKPEMSNRAIAEHCGVHDVTVGKVRCIIYAPEQGYSKPPSMPPSMPPGFVPSPPPGPPPSRRVGKDGKSYPAAPPSMPPKPKVEVDEIGYPIPEGVVAKKTWNERHKVIGIMQEIRRIQLAVEKIEADADLFFRNVSLQSVGIHLANAIREIRPAKPYAVCPYCRGNGCQSCKARGMVDKTFWDVAAAQELKDMMLAEVSK